MVDPLAKYQYQQTKVFVYTGAARCRSVVDYLCMVRWVMGLMPHDKHIELFLIPASAPQLV